MSEKTDPAVEERERIVAWLRWRARLMQAVGMEGPYLTLSIAAYDIENPLPIERGDHLVPANPRQQLKSEEMKR